MTSGRCGILAETANSGAVILKGGYYVSKKQCGSKTQ